MLIDLPRAHRTVFEGDIGSNSKAVVWLVKVYALDNFTGCSVINYIKTLNWRCEN